MGLTKDRLRADLGADGMWDILVHQKIKQNEIHYIAEQDGERVLFETRPLTVSAGYEPETFNLPNGMTLTVGYVSLTKLGAEFRMGDLLVHRTTERPWRQAGKFDKKAEVWKQKSDELVSGQTSAEQQAMLERQKALRPSIIVDIAFGVLFFFVAREFGLVTAALSGAAATLALFAIQPFTKHDLLGGFAVFGVVMSLISAGIAYGFQDDLAVKLRGTFMAIIGACFSLYDAIVLKGGYLGKRMAMYMEGLYKLNHRKASFALAGATLILMGIDTPLAFILTTDQWIWYNSFFDNLIGIPIILGSLYFARETGEPAA